MQLLPDTIVCVRRCRWRVVSVRPSGDCALVTLRGVSPPVAGAERRLLAEFERFESTEPRRDLPFVRRRRWRRACRAALASATPPGALHTAATTRIDLLPFQLEPALAVVSGAGCRVLLADEVGLGKTIQAALTVAELRARGAAERILVLTPAGLRDQWRAELTDRFNLPARTVDARAIRELAATLPPSVNPWSTVELAIASIDFVKRADVFAAASSRPWDAVVVDEAHRAASDSDRRAAVDALCSLASYVVLVTATPHDGNDETFASLCRLGAADADEALTVFRRTRRDAGVDTPRRINTLRVRLAPAERRLHAALRGYTDAIVAERPDVWLAASVLHKRALSSAAALAESIDRRLAQLDAVDTAATSQLSLPLARMDDATTEDELPPWDPALSLSNPARERALLGSIARAARRAARHESKIGALSRLLRRVREPAVVFTEYRDTLLHLQRALKKEAIVLHGAMSRDERARAVDAFTASSSAILLATDAAGEGLNLHRSCRLVVNLELPWNPMRLEQRIGRVDRIGQQRRVHAVHLVARGTREIALLSRLRTRVAQAQQSIGAPNPLDAVDDRAAAEIVVLGRDPTDTPRPASSAAIGIASVSLAQEARREAERLAVVRRLLVPDAELAAVQMRARAKLRRLLRGRRLEIWRLAANDGNGLVATSYFVALLVDLDQVDVAAVVDAAACGWRTSADAVARAFAAARISRDTALLNRQQRPAVPLRQPSLFANRRQERQQLLTLAERDVQRAIMARRVEVARTAAALTFRPAELLAIAIP